MKPGPQAFICWTKVWRSIAPFFSTPLSIHPHLPPSLSLRSLHTPLPPPPHSVYPFTFIVLDVDLIVQCPRNLPQIINVGIRFTNVWKISQQNYNFNLGFTGFREIVIFSLNLQSFYMSGSNHAICYNYVIWESVYVQYVYLFVQNIKLH